MVPLRLRDIASDMLPVDQILEVVVAFVPVIAHVYNALAVGKIICWCKTVSNNSNVDVGIKHS